MSLLVASLEPVKSLKSSWLKRWVEERSISLLADQILLVLRSQTPPVLLLVPICHFKSSAFVDQRRTAEDES